MGVLTAATKDAFSASLEVPAEVADVLRVAVDLVPMGMMNSEDKYFAHNLL